MGATSGAGTTYSSFCQGHPIFIVGFVLLCIESTIVCLLALVLSVILRITAFDNPLGFFKLFESKLYVDI